MRSALNQISLYHDDECKELIKYSRLESHGKLKIVLGSNNFFDDSNQTLTINFNDIGRVKYLENEQHRSVSLNGVLTHELVHAADNLYSEVSLKEAPEHRYEARKLKRQATDPREHSV